MSSSSITIKPNNHRVYQCPSDKKVELIKKLISDNSKLDILIVCSKELDTLKEQIADKGIKIIEDKELVKDKELSCELLISYDLPIKAIVYMARVSKATQKAFILIDKSEQKGLHSIETLLGRAIKQDVIEGFEYEVIKVPESDKYTPKKMTQEQIREVAKKRYEEKTQTAPKKSDKPKRSDSSDGEKWAKKKKAPNKFLGKDENGKALFSGKDGERNHRYDGSSKAKYDAPKKVGRKISIKAVKPKAEKED